jgi:hypothetical protein
LGQKIRPREQRAAQVENRRIDRSGNPISEIDRALRKSTGDTHRTYDTN